MTETAEPSKGRIRIPRWLRLTLGAVIVIAAFCFLVGRLIRDWNQVPFHQLRFSPIHLVASFAILFGLHFPLGAYAWKVILRGFDEHISTFKSLTIITVTQIGKYIPGKVWFTLGRMSLAKKEGIPQAKTLMSVLVEAGFALLAAILLFGIAILFAPRSSVPGPVYLLFIAAPLCLVVIYPPILNRVLRFALRKLKQPVFELKLSYLRMLYILLLYTLGWFMQGIGCFILINSFYPLALGKLPVLLGGYSISWILGFLTLIAPAGLGIREGIFTFILRMIIPEPVAIIAALLTRVWITVAEAAISLASLLYISIVRKHAQKTKENSN